MGGVSGGTDDAIHFTLRETRITDPPGGGLAFTGRLRWVESAVYVNADDSYPGARRGPLRQKQESK